MKTARVFYNHDLAGELRREENGFVFRYRDEYFRDPRKPPISLSLPKSKPEYRSEQLFPFFYGLLSEGETKAIQCRTLKIDEDDHFERLVSTGGTATIGAVTVEEAR